MAIDIQKAIGGNPIKNGTLVGPVTRTGTYWTYDRYVSNSPSIADIETKYQERFNNPSYYYGGGGSGGGCQGCVDGGTADCLCVPDGAGAGDASTCSVDGGTP